MDKNTTSASSSLDYEPWRQSLVERLFQERKSLGHDYIMDLYRFQYECNPVYHEYANLIGRTPEFVQHLKDIPFLPISFFKTHEVRSGQWIPFQRFESSTTTGSEPSIHYVHDEKIYLHNTRACWKQFFKDCSHYCFLGLLPNYLERGNSSLVKMVDYFIQQSKYVQSDFYLYDHEALASTLREVKEEGIPTVLIGVSYALLDFAERYPMDLSGMIIMETGGMKGNRPEMSKEALHRTLKDSFDVKKIYSEYGMTECFSQMYSLSDTLFDIPRSMHTAILDINDPLTIVDKPDARGRLAIIDMANIDSCAFIATDDLAERHGDQLKIIGRIQDADLRGCNLMVN